MTVVVALGGNALARPAGPISAEVQSRNVDLAANALMPLLHGDRPILITHGAGVRIDRLDATGAWRLLAEGQVARGSMAPKVEGAARFADFCGTTMIGSLDQVEDLLAGRAGTVIAPHAHSRAAAPGEAAGDPAPASGSAPMAERAVSSRMGT